MRRFARSITRQPVTRLIVFGIVAAMFAALPRASLAQSSGRATSTQIKIFVPYAPDGTLSPSLQVRSRDSFPNLQCQAGAISTTRPDAWRCGTDDPCFAPAFTDPNATSVALACSTGPWTGNVQLLTIQGSLRTADDCKSPPTCRQPLDLNTNPWAVELTSGVRCTLLTGTISSEGGVGMVYGCANSDGSPAGEAGTAKQGLDRSQALWQVFYQAPGDYALQQTGVAVAWW